MRSLLIYTNPNFDHAGFQTTQANCRPKVTASVIHAEGEWQEFQYRLRRWPNDVHIFYLAGLEKEIEPYLWGVLAERAARSIPLVILLSDTASQELLARLRTSGYQIAVIENYGASVSGETSRFLFESIFGVYRVVDGRLETRR